MWKCLLICGKLAAVRRETKLRIGPCAFKYGVQPSMVGRQLQRRDTMEHVPSGKQETQERVITK